ncbi:hypothetical protein K466DRAFT_563218 [Polyporus arcularius HHB13444]|uniref:Uncharacterized protein n=1 Tax=Polyporus arcularius HHB13444 TaxID=1314778 RepID=A0A5C3PY15_9APHY|nr:hypothetical protein K466DRAFT_563218 [Polyporus arcularius HHB13444]
MPFHPDPPPSPDKGATPMSRELFHPGNICNTLKRKWPRLKVWRSGLSLPYDDRRLCGQLSSLPAGYALHDTAPHPDHELRLTIAMPKAHESGLYMALRDVRKHSAQVADASKCPKVLTGASKAYCRDSPLRHLAKTAKNEMSLKQG